MIPHKWSGTYWNCLVCGESWQDPCGCPCHDQEPTEFGMKYYNRQGQRIPGGAWLAYLQDRQYRVVAQSALKGCYVSTVWLGINHYWGSDPNHLPVIFETMIGIETGTRVQFDDQFQWRYCTEDEATRGHAEAVALIESGAITEAMLSGSE